MEQQQQQQMSDLQDQSGNGMKSNGGGGGGFMCRQSSTRWTPTSDQIRILKELYYNNGVRSPSAEQIQRISARLRQYGKIEGKNVFYWFQNHKARERQKKRFTTTTTITDHHHHHPHLPIYNNKYPHITPPAGVTTPCSSSSSPGMVAVGQMGSYAYGSVTMEKSFRDCSISAGGGGGTGGSIGHNFGWVGVDSYSYPPFFDKRKSSIDQTLEDHQEQEDDHKPQEIETLPLFPMHGEDRFAGFCNNIKPESAAAGYHTGWYRSDNGKVPSRTSLELSLNSYAGRSSGSN